MKKEYSKPQVVEVKLEVQNPVLAGCTNTDPTEKFVDCTDLSDPCQGN